MDYAKESLKMHYDLKGKIEVVSRAKVDSKDALSLAYTQGVAQLAEGMDADEVISRLEGIRCGERTTSCPDQLAQALKEYV